jgi:hypothetical protein
VWSRAAEWQTYRAPGQSTFYSPNLPRQAPCLVPRFATKLVSSTVNRCNAVAWPFWPVTSKVPVLRLPLPREVVSVYF